MAASAAGTETMFYIDGVYVGTSAAKVTAPVVVLGSDYNGGNSISPIIDDVRIYNRALSALEILQLSEVPSLLDTDGDGLLDDVDTDDDGDGVPDVWETDNGLNALVDDADLDPDTDGFTNLEEYIAGTDPQNTGSLLQISSFNLQPSSLAFDSVTGRLYNVEYKDNLSASNWVNLATNLSGTGASIDVNDLDVISQRFYRINVRLQ